jgi:hypothetical protein
MFGLHRYWCFAQAKSLGHAIATPNSGTLQGGNPLLGSAQLARAAKARHPCNRNPTLMRFIEFSGNRLLNLRCLEFRKSLVETTQAFK